MVFIHCVGVDGVCWAASDPADPAGPARPRPTTLAAGAAGVHALQCWRERALSGNDLGVLCRRAVLPGWQHLPLRSG